MIHAEQTCIFRERTLFLKLTKFHVCPTKIDCWVGLRKIDARTATAEFGLPLMVKSMNRCQANILIEKGKKIIFIK